MRKYGSHYQYINFENLQIVSPSEDVKIINVLGHYLRKYGNYYKWSDRVVKSANY